MRTRLAAAAAVVAVLAASCGTAGPELAGAGDTTSEAGAATGTATATPGPPAPTDPAETVDPGTTPPAQTEGGAPAAAVAALDFTAPDVGGGEVRGASYAGRDVALWMWAPW